MNVSKTQIDRLGERLKKGEISGDDLRLLDAYRLAFAAASGDVVRIIQEKLKLEPNQRPAKTTIAISEKLRRESIRLTQMQDIAGCRLVVPDITTQDRVVQSLQNLFEGATVIDRRQKPSHGYRAVHVVVTHLGKIVEIQVRTELQQLWAQLSEKLSDTFGASVKYGGGSEMIKELLAVGSEQVANDEAIEMGLMEMESELFQAGGEPTDEAKLELSKFRGEHAGLRQAVFEYFHRSIEEVERMKGESDDLSNRV